MQANWRAAMKRQQIRKLLLIISLLLFPVTLYYFSPALILEAAGQGIINGSFIVFVLMFLFSIPFGRLFCSYLCPSGGLQECAFAVTEKNPKQGWKNYIKYVIWGFLVFMVTLSFLNSKKIVTVDFFYQTEKGISVSSIQGYIIYYAILALIFIPSVLAGKRTFCHYFCWMAPFMILGTKLRKALRLPGLHIRANKKEDCIACGKCNKTCLMAVDVMGAIELGKIDSDECIQCGACVDNCPKKLLSYAMIARKK